MSDHGPIHPPAGIPLEAHVEELRRRCEAVSRLQGGPTYHAEELGIFRAYAEEHGLILATPPDELNRAPDEEGNEHQVWYLHDTETVLKATWPGFFGLLVIHRPHEEPKASPVAYLERWHLHNRLFGDQVVFLGALRSDTGLRLLIRQPAIAGTPATGEEIRHFFTTSGWRPFVIDGNTAYFDPERQIVISDTHRGNLILMDDGLLAPIDLRVQPVSGTLLDTVTRLCERQKNEG
jgi:Serine/Threonine/Tyrosine Kinase found in polyvalent proteins